MDKVPKVNRGRRVADAERYVTKLADRANLSVDGQERRI